MINLIVGLVLFLGPHSIRIVADDWRTRQINLRGEMLWQGIYSIISIIGFVLIVQGYGQARLHPTVVWMSPEWLKYTAAILMLPTFVLLFAAYVPGTHIKSAIGHPMVAGVKLWAFAHLLANGNVADIILFGAFMLWAIFSFRASRRRDKKTNTQYPATGKSRDIGVVIAGLGFWFVFALYLHEWLIGVKPFA